METCLEQAAPTEPVWLLEGLRSGSNEAYEALVARFQQPVYNLVYRLIADPCEASDVVQEVFWKVFRNIGTFRGKSSLKTWIYRISVNEARNYRRWFARHRRREIGLESEDDGARSLADTIPDAGRSPFDLAAGRQTRELVEQALAEVKPVFRAAVILRDMQDMSYEEIADVLEVSIGTVKSRILRGRNALRKALAGRVEPGLALKWRTEPAEPV
ncbi:MAG: sigma-70 family RNA polymerase sigma factor [Acidobacteria bacterium]|nr:sigma-70 family RNA polymerase sigma factor [Acidobacteriota bacterium]